MATKDNQYIIFGVGDNDILKESQFRAWMADRGYGYKNLFLVLNASEYGPTEQERGFITNKDNFSDIAHAGWLNGQESYILLSEADRHGYRSASIQPMGDHTGEEEVQMGKWTSVSKKAAETAYSGYVYDIESGLYFVALGAPTGN